MGKGSRAAILALVLAATPALADEPAMADRRVASPGCGPERFAAATLTANHEGFLVLVLSGCSHDAVVRVTTLALGDLFRIRGTGSKEVRVPAGKLVAVVIPAAVDNGLGTPSWMFDARIESVLAANAPPSPPR